MIQRGTTVGARWEKVGQGWRRVRPYLGRGLLWSLVGLVVAAAIWVLIYVPKMQVPVCPPDQSGLPPKICFDIENEARRTLAYILGGLLAIIGIYMAHRRIRALERQVQIGQEQIKVAQEGQITERFTRAIEQLGSQEMAIRLGGIYALERIANDSDKDYWPIMETLTAYVRERAPWREPVISQESLQGEKTTGSGIEDRIKPAIDIQAILTVLGRRKYHYGEGEERALDLREADLRGADLSESHLEGTDFRNAHLEGADFFGSFLKEAFFISAHLEKTNLSGARLEGSFFFWAFMKDADLKEAHIEGADFSRARGLTCEQVDQAILNEETVLPKYLQEQAGEVPVKGKMTK